ERLQLEDPLLPRWRDVLANLTLFPTDSSGLMVGRVRPWKESHRHYSHLLAIYPLHLVTPDRPDARSLIEASLRTWERDAALFRGYSFTGGASMHALLGQGDTALNRLNRYLDAPRYMEPNTFYAEAGPVIETPLSAATSIQDMLLQDWGGALRVFPAVPNAWTDAAFDRLRADDAAARGESRDATSVRSQPVSHPAGWARSCPRAGAQPRVLTHSRARAGSALRPTRRGVRAGRPRRDPRRPGARHHQPSHLRPVRRAPGARHLRRLLDQKRKRTVALARRRHRGPAQDPGPERSLARRLLRRSLPLAGWDRPARAAPHHCQHHVGERHRRQQLRDARVLGAGRSPR